MVTWNEKAAGVYLSFALDMPKLLNITDYLSYVCFNLPACVFVSGRLFSEA